MFLSNIQPALEGEPGKNRDRSYEEAGCAAGLPFLRRLRRFCSRKAANDTIADFRARPKDPRAS